jgi:hypothetical protein
VVRCPWATRISNFTCPPKILVAHHEQIFDEAYSLQPKLHFDTNLIFVSLLVPEILAHFFCPSGKSFLEKMKDLCQDFHYSYFTITFATKSAQ